MEGGVTNDFCCESLQQGDKHPVEEKQTEPEHSSVPGAALEDPAGYFGVIVGFALLALGPSLCQGPTGPSPPLLLSFLLDAGIQLGDCSNPQYGVLDPLENQMEKEYTVTVVLHGICL